MNIVAKHFTASEFADYCKQVQPQSWVKRIVLHNTSSPSLAQRPGGVLTAEHIQNLKGYYEGQGWSAGPHLFVDATGIWVFTSLTEHGVHSPSYNGSSWGVEMLGDYDTESFTTGLGAQVRANAIAAVASLARIQGWPDVKDGRLILHKEDPKTTHKDCPGKAVVKADFVAAVSEFMKAGLRIVVEGTVVAGFQKDGVTYAPVRALAEALGCKVGWDPAKQLVTVTK